MQIEVATLISILALTAVAFIGGYVIGALTERRARAQADKIPTEL
jgi:hypothetical protein